LTADEHIRIFLKKKKLEKQQESKGKEMEIEPSTQHEHIDENS
jgi:hypothetical protein